MSRLIYPRPSRRNVTIPPEARWAMEAVHRVRACIATLKQLPDERPLGMSADDAKVARAGIIAAAHAIENALEGKA